MLLQIHTLTTYGPSLLNRDRDGMAKRIQFGNASRIRVSSQCLKRHWRDEMKLALADIPDGWRTRAFFTHQVRPRFEDAYAEWQATEHEKKPLDATTVERLLEVLRKNVVPDKESDDGDGSADGEDRPDKKRKGKKSKHASKDAQQELLPDQQAKSENGAEEDEEEDSNGIDTKQPILFGMREADYFAQMMLRACKESKSNPAEALDVEMKRKKKNIQAMSKSAAGLTAALFGRMSTGDILARVDAPVHVAHAFTTHEANTVWDYFAVVDDILKEKGSGAAHINETELGSGTYYGYVVVDIPLLLSNMTGCLPSAWRGQDRQMAMRVLGELIRCVTSKSPGAKKGSTAPYAVSDFTLIEVGKAQPRALANSFLEAVSCNEDVRVESARRLLKYMDRLDRAYGMEAKRFLSTSLEMDVPIINESRQDAIDHALDAIWI